MVELSGPLTLGEEVVDEEAHRCIIVSVHESGASVDMYIGPHEEYPDIVPDDATGCSLFDEPTDGSPTTALPEDDRNAFAGVVDTLLDGYGFTLTFNDNDEPYGICTACLGNETEELLFTVHLSRNDSSERGKSGQNRHT